MILEVFNRYQYFGGEELAADAISALVKEAYPIERCFFDSSEWLGADAPPMWRQALWLGDNPEARRRVREASEAAGARIWLFHNLIPVASLGLYDEARRQDKPVIQYIHNFRPFSPGGTLWVNGAVDDSAMRGRFWPEIRSGSWQGSVVKTAILAWHIRRLMRSRALDNVRAWVAISDFMAGKFIEAGIPAGRVQVLRHSWDAREERKKPVDEGYYLFLGRLVSEKGVDTLLEAWRNLSMERGGALPELVIAGDGPLRARVEAAAERDSRIRYAGFVQGEAKQALIDGARALLAPSVWWEPLGLVTYEAYDASKPMIAAASGGLSETVVDGETGYLFPPGDAQALAERIGRMEAMDAGQRREMGQAGRQWLLRHASRQIWQEGFARIVSRALPGW